MAITYRVVRLADDQVATLTPPAAALAVVGPGTAAAAQRTTQASDSPGATAAKQDTGNASLASIDESLPALGQALAASSIPVVLTAIQIAALTPAVGAGTAAAAQRVTIASDSPAAVVRGGAKGATAAADVTSSSGGADHNGLDVNVINAPAFEDGVLNVALTQRRPLSAADYTPSFFANRGANSTLNVAAGSHNVFGVSCLNVNAALRYLQLHNTATVPANPDVPKIEFPVPASGGFIQFGEDFFTENGINFPLGIAFAVSTTRGTYTAATAADHDTQVVYK